MSKAPRLLFNSTLGWRISKKRSEGTPLIKSTGSEDSRWRLLKRRNKVVGTFLKA